VQIIKTLELRGVVVVVVEQTLRKQRDVSHCGLTIYMKKYVKAKEEL